MKKVLLLNATRALPRMLPGVFAFFKRWWLPMLLALLVMGGLMVWAAIALVLWVWETLPHLMSYVVNHFAPVWQNVPQPAPSVEGTVSL